jgi:CBS domain containing-hemolysin-like protein
MKIIFQILILATSLFLQKTTFAAAYFEVSPLNEIIISKKEKIKNSVFKNWRKPTKKQEGKHGERWFIGGILGLTALFGGLKIAEIIAWSWLWVFSPIWITAVLLLLLFIYVVILFLIIGNKNEKIEIVPKE